MMPAFSFITIVWLVLAALAAGCLACLIVAIVNLARHPASTHCARCRYSRAGSDSVKCPECGFGHDQSRWRLIWTRQRYVRRALLSLLLIVLIALLTPHANNWTRLIPDWYLVQHAPVCCGGGYIDQSLHLELVQRLNRLDSAETLTVIERQFEEMTYHEFIESRDRWPANLPVHFTISRANLLLPEGMTVQLRISQCGIELGPIHPRFVHHSPSSTWFDQTTVIHTGCLEEGNSAYVVAVVEDNRIDSEPVRVSKRPIPITLVDSLEDAVGLVTDAELPLAEHMEFLIDPVGFRFDFSSWEREWMDVAIGLNIKVVRNGSVISNGRFWVKDQWQRDVYFDSPLPPGTLDDSAVEIIVEPDPEMALCDFSKPRIWMGEPFRVPLNPPAAGP